MSDLFHYNITFRIHTFSIYEMYFIYLLYYNLRLYLPKCLWNVCVLANLNRLYDIKMMNLGFLGIKTLAEKQKKNEIRFKKNKHTNKKEIKMISIVIEKLDIQI